MSFTELTDEERQVVREVVVAVLLSPDIPSAGYLPRYAANEKRMKILLRRWPDFHDQNDAELRTVINNCFGEVCDGIAFAPDDPDVEGMPNEKWSYWFSVSREKVEEVYYRWRKGNERDEIIVGII